MSTPPDESAHPHTDGEQDDVPETDAPVIAGEADADADDADETETIDVDVTLDAPPEAVGAREGRHVIRAQLRHLPNGPGVYRMLDAKGEVLYVGKAKSLKKRVASYANGVFPSNRIARMVSETAALEVVTTHTEVEALLLEANLIKRLKPRFNVLLRDDKSFPFIALSRRSEWVRIEKHRGAQSEPGDYFGPFASAGAVNRTLNTLQRAFLLRSCTDSVFQSRTRPCLLYQIKRCSGPCVGLIGKDDYEHLVGQARAFLSGESHEVQRRLSTLMEEASEALDFERAAVLRDRIRALSQVQARQDINVTAVDEADVVAIHQEGGLSCVQVFFFRAGQNWGNRAYFPRHDRNLELPEVLASFLAQFYDDKPVPKLVLTSIEVEGAELLAEALSLKAGRRVHIQVPKRGDKLTLVEHALTNAREALGRRMAESATQTRLLEGVAEAFGLDAPPARIEVYDNSHIMGTNAIGAMIVAGPEGMIKNGYRKFNIRSTALTPGDDYGMMREVLTRRFARLAEEDPSRERGQWPDLVIIDGGQGQLAAARQVMEEAGIDDVALVAIAKGPDRNAGRERFFMNRRPPFSLEEKSPVLYFLQRLRDEAHRFAIGTHRAKRAKDFLRSGLDDVPGIGPARKRALLNHFGSARGVANAGLTDLARVEGISETVAKRIYDHFHPQG
jgi:excinuclease ABC subunit C